jgi:hypothetical protein
MRRLFVTCGLAAAFLGLSAQLRAYSGDSPPSPFSALSLPQGRAELSSGFDQTANGGSTYGTAVIGISGPLHNDGWRLRLAGGYAVFTYQSRMAYCQLSAEEKKQRTGTNFGDLCNDIAGEPPQGEQRDELADYLAPYGLSVEGDQIYADFPHQQTRYNAAIAPGYQASFGALILKAYLGLAYELHLTTPPDATASLQGSEWGAQGVLEAWLPLGEAFWLSADSSYFTGTNGYGASMKLGYRAASWIAFGPELAAYGDDDDATGRAGAFLRFDALGMETTVAGGMSGTYRDEPSAYGNVSMYMKF